MSNRLDMVPDVRKKKRSTTAIGPSNTKRKQPSPCEPGCSLIVVSFRLSPDPAAAGRGFGRDGLNSPCRPEALEEFFPFQESR